VQALVSPSVKKWLPQSEKLGVHIFCTAQDYGQVAKDFRRLVKKVYEVKQVFGPKRPGPNLPYKPRFILGLQILHSLDPRQFDGDQMDMATKSLIPSFKWYTRAAVERYDTNKLVIESPLAPLKHIARICNEPGCKHEHHPLITHR